MTNLNELIKYNYFEFYLISATKNKVFIDAKLQEQHSCDD